MKKYIIIALLSVFTTTAFSQSADLRRRIEVSGTSEQEVTPDIIYVSISLKEYFRDNNVKKKVEIEDLEKQLFNAVLNAGIPKENLTVNNVSAFRSTVKKNPEFLASKQYRLKVSDLNSYNQIISGIDSRGIQFTNVDSYDYSKIEDLKKELKIKALKMAREKAVYLSEALNNRIGEPLEVQEINNEFFPQPLMRSASFNKLADAESAQPEIDFKKIKLNYTMRVVFELIK